MNELSVNIDTTEIHPSLIPILRNEMDLHFRQHFLGRKQDAGTARRVQHMCDQIAATYRHRTPNMYEFTDFMTHFINKLGVKSRL